MCGRFSLALLPETLADYFGLDQVPVDLLPRYNIAPGQAIAIIRFAPGLGRHLDIAHWGLVPSWAKDASIGHKLINARAESLAQKPAFRNAYRQRRCLIPADGFYEWHAENDGKQPYWISSADSSPLAFAGLWESWEAPQTGEHLESCTIITTTANAQLAPLHERMPVILPAAEFSAWLAPQATPTQLGRLLRPYPGTLHIHPVSREVNSPLKDNPHLVKPVKPARGSG